MLAPSPVVKYTAKNALKHRLLHSVAVVCIFLFAYFAILFIGSLMTVVFGQIGGTAIMFLLQLFILCPLVLGVINYFRRLLWQQKDSILISFKYFSNLHEYKRAIKFIFFMAARFALAAAVLYFPCFIVWLLSNEQLYILLDVSLPIWASNLWALNSLLLIVSTMAFVFTVLKYYLAPFIFVSNNEIDTEEAINMSTIISKRTGADFVGLVLSFAGWILLSLLVSPLIFTAPYFIAAYCVHCRFAITAYNKDVDQFNASITPSFSTEEI